MPLEKRELFFITIYKPNINNEEGRFSIVDFRKNRGAES